MSEPTPRGELVLYATEDGSAQFFLRAEDGSVWLSQSEIAELFSNFRAERQYSHQKRSG